MAAARTGDSDSPATPTTSPESSSLALLASVLTGIVVVLAVVGGGLYFAYDRWGRTARPPAELVARFDEAGVSCRSRRPYDLGRTKMIWCATPDGKVVTVTTYAHGPDYEEWLTTHCAIASNRRARGVVVDGDDWVIDVRSLVDRRPSPRRVAIRLSRVLGGEVHTYACAKLR